MCTSRVRDLCFNCCVHQQVTDFYLGLTHRTIVSKRSPNFKNMSDTSNAVINLILNLTGRELGTLFEKKEAKVIMNK